MKAARCDTCDCKMHRVAVTALQRCQECRRQYLNAQSRAMYAVSTAIAARKLKPASCFLCVHCGFYASEYDHRDYTKPLDVSPVCDACNNLRGPGVWRTPSGRLVAGIRPFRPPLKKYSGLKPGSKEHLWLLSMCPPRQTISILNYRGACK